MSEFVVVPAIFQSLPVRKPSPNTKIGPFGARIHRHLGERRGLRNESVNLDFLGCPKADVAYGNRPNTAFRICGHVIEVIWPMAWLLFLPSSPDLPI